MFFWLAPLRKAQQRITNLEKRLEGTTIAQIRADLETEHNRTVECAASCNRSMNGLAREIEKIQLDRRESVRTLHTKIDELATTTNNGFRDVERAIGRLEGKTEA